jgi:hypothetical protein
MRRSLPAACADRLGVAALTRMHVGGHDLRPLWQNLIAKLINGTIEAGEGLDLSLIAQLLGDKQAGLAIQQQILSSHQLFRVKNSSARLRVLAFAAATDIGGNTPIEFLLTDSGIELMTLYVVPDAELPASLPDHDVAIVIASGSEDGRDAVAAAAAQFARACRQSRSRQIASRARRRRRSGDSRDRRRVARAIAGDVVRGACAGRVFRRTHFPDDRAAARVPCRRGSRESR